MRGLGQRVPWEYPGSILRVRARSLVVRRMRYVLYCCRPHWARLRHCLQHATPNQVCMGDRSLCACWLPPAHALVLGGSPHFRAPSSLRELRGHSCEHLGLLARSHAAWDTAPRGILSLAERIGPGFMTRRMRCGTTLPSDAACGAHQVRSMQHDTLRATCNTRHATCNTTRGVHGALHARFHVVLLRAQRTPCQLCVFGDRHYN